MAVSFIITVSVIVIVKQVQLGCELIALHGIIVIVALAAAVWA